MACRNTIDPPLLSVDLDLSVTAHCIHDEAGLLGIAVCDAHDASPLGCRQLKPDVAVTEVDAVVIWTNRLRLVAEMAAAAFHLLVNRARNGDDRDLTEVVHPRTRLVREAHTVELRARVVVKPPFPVSGLGDRRPHGTAPRTADGRIHVARRQRERVDRARRSTNRVEWLFSPTRHCNERHKMTHRNERLEHIAHTHFVFLCLKLAETNRRYSPRRTLPLYTIKFYQRNAFFNWYILVCENAENEPPCHAETPK